jgi:hypothetical protein
VAQDDDGVVAEIGPETVEADFLASRSIIAWPAASGRAACSWRETPPTR